MRALLVVFLAFFLTIGTTTYGYSFEVERSICAPLHGGFIDISQTRSMVEVTIQNRQGNLNITLVNDAGETVYSVSVDEDSHIISTQVYPTGTYTLWANDNEVSEEFTIIINN